MKRLCFIFKTNIRNILFTFPSADFSASFILQIAGGGARFSILRTGTKSILNLISPFSTCNVIAGPDVVKVTLFNENINFEIEKWKKSFENAQ